MRLIPLMTAVIVATASILPVAHAEVFKDGSLDNLGIIPSAQPIKPAAKPVPIKKQAEEAYAFQQLDESEPASFTGAAGEPETETKTLQGAITSIRVARGRSQIIKFAQPIMRISIAEPTVADIIPLGPDQIMINGKLRGVTSLIVWDENGQEGIFDLYVQNDTSELLDAVKAIAPNEKIQARVTDDTFILTGQVSNTVILDEIRQIAAAYGYPDAEGANDKFKDLTETPVPQVVLQVKIAEANRSVGRILKSSFEYAMDSRGDFNLVRLANPLDSEFLSNINRATAGLAPSAFGPIGVNQSGSNTGGVTGGYEFSDQLSVFWDALETSGKINTLANPTLVCTHGREAEFLAGGEFPYRSGTDQSGQPIVNFKEFGVKLKFTPWIAIRTGRIELRIESEVSNRDLASCIIGQGGDQVCGVATRRTSTTVDLQDGDSLMISGILTREEQNTMGKVPFIGNVPILGNFFKNGDMSKSDRELVVIISPQIVKPTHYGKILGAAR